jgi:hypothetical protein
MVSRAKKVFRTTCFTTEQIKSLALYSSHPEDAICFLMLHSDMYPILRSFERCSLN